MADTGRHGSLISLPLGAREGIEMKADKVYESVSNYYGKVLSSSKDLKTSACTTSMRPSEEVIEVPNSDAIIAYILTAKRSSDGHSPLCLTYFPHPFQALTRVPSTIKDRFYGCGTPLPQGITGLDLLDLGSGSGRDCYVAAAMVGPNGSVTGVDMTDEQLEVASKFVPEYMDTLGYKTSNLKFKKGYIEFLKDAGGCLHHNPPSPVISVVLSSPPTHAALKLAREYRPALAEKQSAGRFKSRERIEPESVDMVISNCVINLSPNKATTWLMMEGVLHDRTNSNTQQSYQHHYRICQSLHISYLFHMMMGCSNLHSRGMRRLLCGSANFYSITYRCFKLSNMETLCEDYGQVAYYKGTLPNNPNSYMLDDHHVFETGKPMLVCGNTASMVSETWMKEHFEVVKNNATRT
eukprot:jgi/Bigna1/81221/fgenesh1_pg.78_\